MKPGPSKQFDPDVILERARDLFWRNGYDGTAISELESTLGIGRKSLYDTFGGKRDLYLRAIEHYVDNVIARICRGLADSRNDALANLERVLDRLQRHHGSSDSHGCLLGVAMAQADRDDVELKELLGRYLGRLERAFEGAIRRARADGLIDVDVRPKDEARHLVTLTQGMALMGRVVDDAAVPRGVIRAVLRRLRRS